MTVTGIHGIQTGIASLSWPGAPATITKWDVQETGDSAFLDCEYKYIIAGKEYTNNRIASYVLSKDDIYKIGYTAQAGSVHEMYYDPANPKNSVLIKGWRCWVPLLGIAFFCGSIGLIIAVWKNRVVRESWGTWPWFSIEKEKAVARHKIVADTPSCDVSQIPAVFDRLKKDGKDESFAIFMFQPPNQPRPKDVINIQFSIEDGRVGLDWCLIGPSNIRDKEKFERCISMCGSKSQLREANQVKYLRVEDGDLPLLCQKVICDLYEKKAHTKLEMVVEGFQWPGRNQSITS